MAEKRYYDRAYWPCINIKCRGMFDADDFMKKYHCDEKTAEHAVDMIQNVGFDLFWDDVTVETELLFGEGARPVQFGRSGGWMSVSTLKDMVDLEDYENYTGDPEEDKKKYEEDTKALAELEAYCHSLIKEMAKLDYWEDYIKEHELAKGWYCKGCGAFHPSKEEGGSK